MDLKTIIGLSMVLVWTMLLSGRIRFAIGDRLLRDEHHGLGLLRGGGRVEGVLQLLGSDEDEPIQRLQQPLLIVLVPLPREGDDTIVDTVAALTETVTTYVVTADRELRRRCQDERATALGPKWLLNQLR